METQVSLDDKIRSTFGKALLDALSENRSAVKSKSRPPVHSHSVKIKEKRYNIMLASLEGYPGLYASASAGQEQVQKDFMEIVEAAAAAHRGSIVKNTESTCLVTFETSTDVLRAGLKIESTVARYNKDNDPITTKIVINTDEVVSEEWGELFKKFMNRVIQKEKISRPGERPEKAAEPIKIAAKREMNWGSAVKTENGVRPLSNTTPLAEAATRTITEKRLPNSPRIPVKVVTHKRELPEGAQQFPPHFIHEDRSSKSEADADWSHRLFLAVVALLLFIGGFFVFKSVGRNFDGRFIPLKEKLSQSAMISSNYIQSKFFSGKGFQPIASVHRTAVPPPIEQPADIIQEKPNLTPATEIESAAIPAPPASAPPAAPAIIPNAAPAKPPVPRFETAELQMQYADQAATPSDRIDAYRAVIRNYPNSSYANESQIAIGKIRIELGQYAVAKAVFDDLLWKNPAPDEAILAETHFQLGMAYWKDKDYSNARGYFERVIELYPRMKNQVQESRKMLAIVKQDNTQN